jgi:peptidyl-tRNA hydrolase
MMSKISNYFNLKLKSLIIRVSECYKNEKRIDQSCKQIIIQSNLLLKQSQAWINLIGQFTVALKVSFLIK